MLLKHTNVYTKKNRYLNLNFCSFDRGSILGNNTANAGMNLLEKVDYASLITIPFLKKVKIKIKFRFRIFQMKKIVKFLKLIQPYFPEK